MDVLRVSALIYGGLGCVFTAANARQWWKETDRVWRAGREQGWWPTLLALVLVTSLAVDVLLWPSCLYRLHLRNVAKGGP